MKEFNNFMGNICIKKGEVFDVSLESQTASTGFIWALSSMPNCLNLLDVAYVSTTSQLEGGKNKQIYKFAAVDDAEAYLEFSLCRPWEPLKIVEKKIFIIHVSGDSKSLENELKATIPANKFLSSTYLKPGAVGMQKPIIPYGVPMTVVEDNEKCHIMYGVPTGIAANIKDCILKYGIPANMVHDEENCTVKYGSPYGAESDPSKCVLKYGIPVNIVQDPCNCVMKYGIPAGVAKNDEECVLKYGAPIDRVTTPGEIHVLYGIPIANNIDALRIMKSAASDDIVVVYGVPDVKYGVATTFSASLGNEDTACVTPYAFVEDETNCVVKYGTPSGIVSDSDGCLLKYGAPVKGR